MINLENTMTRFDNNYELLLLIVDICYNAVNCIYISFTLQGSFLMIFCQALYMERGGIAPMRFCELWEQVSWKDS